MVKTVWQVKNGLQGVITVPGDKSISHRGVMLGSIATGKTTIKGFLPGADCLATIDCLRKLGVEINQRGDLVEVIGCGIEGLIKPKEVLDVGNSGTTLRLLLGILAGTNFHSTLIGDDSISKRPMKRVTEPLALMGANTSGNFTPIHVQGGKLHGITYETSVASAQVKSAILLAGLFAKGVTSVVEPKKSRNHTETMLQMFGVELDICGLSVSVEGGQKLTSSEITVPGDISSAAFFLAAGCLVPNSKITIENVGMNPTRTGFMQVLQEMGANVTITNLTNEPEPSGTITVETSWLRGVEISGEIIPSLIDELPIIALLATQASGTTATKDAKELRVKETDRIAVVVSELSKLGANIQATEDGMIIHGKTELIGGQVSSHKDHRIGMMLAIAGCLATGETVIDGAESVVVSYPHFFEQLEALLL